jgi:hypothetical protein
VLVSSYITPKARQRVASGIEGCGLVALTPIGAGEIVAIRGGHIVSAAALQSLPERLQNSEIQLSCWVPGVIGTAGLRCGGVGRAVHREWLGVGLVGDADHGSERLAERLGVLRRLRCRVGDGAGQGLRQQWAGVGEVERDSADCRGVAVGVHGRVDLGAGGGEAVQRCREATRSRRSRWASASWPGSWGRVHLTHHAEAGTAESDGPRSLASATMRAQTCGLHRPASPARFRRKILASSYLRFLLLSHRDISR